MRIPRVGIVEVARDERLGQLAPERGGVAVVARDGAGVRDVGAGAEEVAGAGDDGDGDGGVGGDLVEEVRDAEVAGLGEGVEFGGDGDGDDGDVVALGEGDGLERVGGLFGGHGVQRVCGVDSRWVEDVRAGWVIIRIWKGLLL